MAGETDSTEGFATEEHDLPGAGPGPDRSRSMKRWGAGAVAAVLLVGTGIGAGLAVAGTSATPAAALSSAAAQTDSSTAHLEFTITPPSSGQNQVGTASGDADLAKKDFELQITSSSELSLFGSTTSQFLLVDGSAYMRFPYAKPPLGGPTWFALHGGTTVDGPLLTFNASQLLSLLKNGGAIVTPEGSQVIDGVTTQKYIVTLKRGPNNGVGSDGGSSPADQFMGGAQSVTVWIGDDGYVHRIAADVGAQDDTVGGSAEIVMTLSDFGEPLDIAAPPASETRSGSELFPDLCAESNASNSALCAMANAGASGEPTHYSTRISTGSAESAGLR
ncbi:MAG TPA: hypothetical protein VEJ87_00360 [Acidimicrobiales bacterium]|nr:hypothetical protein [Acidimicrobiales bacterium]